MPEFRADAVKLVLGQGLSQEVAAKRLAVPKRTLANWVAAAKASTRVAAPGARSVADLEAENTRLRRELAETRMERDVLKRFWLTVGYRVPDISFFGLIGNVRMNSHLQMNKGADGALVHHGRQPVISFRPQVQRVGLVRRSWPGLSIRSRLFPPAAADGAGAVFP